MRLATWNINSVRLRIDLVQKLIDSEQPDVICLQETKVVDDSFPLNAVRDMGFSHTAISGMKSYNGVAILSRLPLTAWERRDWCGRSDCRHVFATLESGIEVHSLYVPSGGDIPDPEENDKFAHKLAFLDEMADWFGSGGNGRSRRILTGDFNIAPLETDVWSHKQLLNIVSHTPIEVEKLNRVQNEGHWIDAIRHFVPAEEKLYTWWSYRARDWAASDRGRRLDHIWVSPDLRDRLTAAHVVRAARGWDQPSDHVPVIVDLNDG